MAKKSTERAMIELKKRGWTHGLVERSVPTGGNQFIRTTLDFLGFADILALDGLPGVLAIQACTTDVQPHVVKMEAMPTVREWLARGNRLELWSFRKVKIKRGGVAFRWALRRLVAEAQETGVAFPECAPEEMENSREGGSG